MESDWGKKAVKVKQFFYGWDKHKVISVTNPRVYLKQELKSPISILLLLLGFDLYS